MNSYAVDVRNISKKYDLYRSPRHRLREALSLRGRTYHVEHWALREVSFKLRKGVTLGILGVNGSGKSTLLRIICGFLAPSGGLVYTQGKICPILELGTGFNPDFTGRENVLMYGGLMGFSRKEMSAKISEIEDFAEIGEFIDRQCRTYSSGMYVRLAFACTIHLEPEILVIDEALSVGDIAFQHKCMTRIRTLQESGVSILFVSHSLGAVKSLCQEALLLDAGRILCSGEAEEVANTYHALVAEREQKKYDQKLALKGGNSEQPISDALSSSDPPPEPLIVEKRNRSGSGEIVIDSVAIFDSQGNSVEKIEFDQEIFIKIFLTAKKRYQSSAIGYLIRDRFGNDLMGTNTYVVGVEMPEFEAGKTYEVVFSQRIPLAMGTYSVSAAVAQEPGKGAYRDWLYCDWWDNAFMFEVLPPDHGRICGAKVQLPVQVSWKIIDLSGVSAISWMRSAL